jgi:hypothetical protein
MPRLFQTPDKFACADEGTLNSIEDSAAAPATSVRRTHVPMKDSSELTAKTGLLIVVEGERQSTVADGMVDSLDGHTCRGRVIAGRIPRGRTIQTGSPAVAGV